MNTNTFKSLILNAAVLLAATLLLSCCRNSSPISQYGWSDEVRTALNDFIGIYGNPEQLHNILGISGLLQLMLCHTR